MWAMTFYNENDPYPAAWLRNLIAAGHIPSGTVDERSISDLEPKDLDGFTQAHFFAGIGGWPLALKLAGVADDFPCWTGSCPCQPFSAAGKRRGADDERHLWPAWFRLIRERHPPIVFGEQVASKDGIVWFDAVRADMEAEGYSVAAADLCAASVGAPHARQRIFWLAHTRGQNVPRPERKTRSLFSKQKKAPAINRDCGLFARDHIVADSIPAITPDGRSRLVAIVRAYGNAIVPQVAAEFITAALEAIR